MTDDPLLRPLADLLNRQIARSVAARDAVDGLHDRTLAIRLRNTGLTLYLAVADGALSLYREFAKEPDAILETTVVGLAQLARGQLEHGHADITGDPAVARRFEELLRATQPDWEEELSRIVGDVAAHQIGNVMRGLAAFGARAADSFTRDTAEFFQEESRDIPAPPEIDRFNREVRDVAKRVDEIAQRIRALSGRLGA